MEDAIHILDREVLVEAWRWHFVEDFGQQLHMRGKSIMTELNWWVFVAFMAPPIKQQLLDKVSDTIKYADLLIDGDTIRKCQLSWPTRAAATHARKRRIIVEAMVRMNRNGRLLSAE